MNPDLVRFADLPIGAMFELELDWTVYWKCEPYYTFFDDGNPIVAVGANHMGPKYIPQSRADNLMVLRLDAEAEEG